MRDALLLLLHQGKSFTYEASTAAAQHGLDLVGLSSRAANPAVVEESRRHLTDCIVTDGSRRPGDVARVGTALRIDPLRRVRSRGLPVMTRCLADLAHDDAGPGMPGIGGVPRGLP